MRAVTVFCGSSAGKDDRYVQAAQDVGRACARDRIEVVYGGGHVGLMGALADACLEANGTVVGVMPSHLVDREIAHRGLSDLVVVDSMHERKSVMSERADGFVVLAGGAGTMEEFFEQWTWSQLGIHAKPIALINTGGFYDPLVSMVDRMVGDGFLDGSYQQALIFSDTAEEALHEMRAYSSPPQKWS